MPRKTEMAHAGEAILGRTKKGGPRDLAHSIPGALTTDYFDEKKP